LNGAVLTYTGIWMRPLEPRPEDINWHDISQGLSNICRFNGHVKEFVSVAEHSVLVSREAEKIASEDRKKMVAMWGLLHDASEAYLCDIPRPLKKQPEFAAYREAEKALMRCVCLRYGLPLEEPEEVREADLRALETEGQELMKNWVSEGVNPFDVTVHCWAPAVAREKFIARWVEIKST